MIDTPIITVADVLIRMRMLPVHLNQLSLNAAEVRILLDWISALELGDGTFKAPLPAEGEDPETYRREKPTLDACPLPDDSVDYGVAGTSIDKAMHHLDEGLPNGQRLRSATAYALLAQGVRDLGLWMKKKGYFDMPPAAK